ncbi:MAG TPA: tetratricopeptide repeat protein, partial [Desulfatiglandales bacterium]|nr:tetratricopeptide repeat protein [Desulfatiglandales bacterium]
MHYSSKIFLFLAGLFLIIFALSFNASAQQSAMNYFVDGVEAFDVADYEKAVTSFKKAIELEPENLEFQYHLGLTYSAMQKQEDALKVFESIVDKEPVRFLKACFDIAAIYASQGKHREAIDALSFAEDIEPTEARIYLEKGYAYQKLKDYGMAIENFNKAKDFNPSMLQVAYYNIAAVYAESEDFDKAEEMFAKAIEVDRDTSIAENARKSIVNIKSAKKARKPWNFSGSFTWAYDDNVLLKALEQAAVVSATGETLDEGDQFQNLIVSAGYKFINRKDLEIGAGYSLYCVGYRDLVESNVLGHIPNLYLQYNGHPFYLRVQYDFSYYYTGADEDGDKDGLFLTFGDGSDDKLRMHSLRPTIVIVEPHDLKSEITFSYQDKDYLDEETSDAEHYLVSFVQSYKIPKKQSFLRAGYKYGYEDAYEEESTYKYHQGLLGVSSYLYWDIWGD